MTSSQKPVDGGGYLNKNLAEIKANEINEYYAKRPTSDEDE